MWTGDPQSVSLEVTSVPETFLPGCTALAAPDKGRLSRSAAVAPAKHAAPPDGQDQKLWSPLLHTQFLPISLLFSPGLWHSHTAIETGPGEGVGAWPIVKPCGSAMGNRKVAAVLMVYGPGHPRTEVMVRPCTCPRVHACPLWLDCGQALPQGLMGTLMPLCLNESRIAELLHTHGRGQPRHRLLRDLMSALGQVQSCGTLPFPQQLLHTESTWVLASVVVPPGLPAQTSVWPGQSS